MKMSILRSGLLFLALFAAVMVSCKKNDDDNNDTAKLKENIAGAWDLTSFKVSGFEYMGIVIESASVDYEAFTGAQGDFSQEVKYLDEDPRETTEGKYEILSGSSVKMTAGGESYTVKVTVNGDNIQIEGEQDGEPMVIKAKRRN